ncbi:MAG: Cof-type HAD-IIB family hydrolase [Clostridia bacterium]|nr:Cof-type HAD-IIB family hydrolase [Clostridia bacterium]
MIKLIASDLDGTALNSGKLSLANKEAISKATKLGYSFVVSTGRALYAVPKDFYDIDEFEYAITCNGACISNVRTGEVLRRFNVEVEDVKKLVEISKKYDVTFEVFTHGSRGHIDKTYHDDPVKYGMLPGLVDYIRTSRAPEDNIYDYIEKNIDSVDNFAFVTPTKEIHDSIVEDVKRLCPNTLMVISEPQWVEVMNINSGKGKGVRYLAEYLGIDMSEVACIGDGDNDIEMLELAGTSIAMGNASIGCKETADYVTLDVDNDGVAHAIDNIINGIYS